MLVYSQPHRSLFVNSDDIVSIPCRNARETMILADSSGIDHMNFSCNFNRSELLDREVFIEYRIVVQLHCSPHMDAGTPTYIPISLPFSEYSLSCNPLHRVMTKSRIVINSSTVSEVNPGILRNPMGWYETTESILELPDVVNNTFAQSRVEVGPMFTDDPVADPPKYAPIDIWARNNMIAESHFRNSIVSNMSQMSRGSYKPLTTVFSHSVAADPVLDTCTLTYHVVERLWHPVLNDKKFGTLTNIRNLDIRLEFGNLQAMMQTGMIVGYDPDDPDDILTTYSPNVPVVSFDTNYAPRLLFRGYHPDPSVAIPRNVQVPHEQYKILPFPIPGTFAPGDSGSYLTLPINLSLVPRQLLMFIRPSAQNLGPECDSYATINSIKLTTSRDSGVLSDSDPFQLHSMCSRNGSRQTYDQFRNMTGSVLCVDFEKSDVSGYIPGEMLNFQFEVSCNFTNTAWCSYDFNENTLLGTGQRILDFHSPLNWSLYIVVVNDGLLNLSETQSNSEYGMTQSRIAKIIRGSLSGLRESRR